MYSALGHECKDKQKESNNPAVIVSKAIAKVIESPIITKAVAKAIEHSAKKGVSSVDKAIEAKKGVSSKK